MLTVNHEVFQKLIEVAKKGAPLETCGMLAGNGQEVSCFIEMTNQDKSHDHFTLVPQEQLQATKLIRRLGLQVMGVVHSHPETPARPSLEDIKLAHDPNTNYFILSLAGLEPDLKAFNIKKNIVTRVAIEIGSPQGCYGQLIIPDKVREDVQGFEKEVNKYLNQETDAVRFRAYRVPMGMYEQRENDTYMARTRLPGGVITKRQLARMNELAKSYGGHRVHLTTRQAIQLHDLKLKDTPTIIMSLLDVDLVCRGGGGNTVRNVTGSPLAGADPNEVFDVLPYVVQVTEYLIPFQSSYQLPRKYKITFASNESQAQLAKIADLGLIATKQDNQEGFIVYVGGGMGAYSKAAIKISDFIPTADVVIWAEAIKRVFDRHGNRANRHKARLRFVVKNVGEEKFKQLLLETIEEVRGEGLEVPRLRFKAHYSLGGEKRTEPIDGVIESDIKGRYHIHFKPLFGDISSDQLETLVAIMDENDATLRLGTDQEFYLLYIKGERINVVVDQLKDLFEPIPAVRPIACAGASTCRLGLCQARGLARAINELVRSWPEDKQRQLPQMRISGCPNSCGQHAIGTLGFSGAAKRINGHLMPFYNVYLKNDDEQALPLGNRIGEIAAKAIPQMLDSFTTLDDLADHLKSFQAVPSYEENPDYYRDWGKTQDFDLAGRGPGECGAGVMDIIELDIKTAITAFKESHSDDSLYQAALSAMRALLITVGVDTQKPRAIFDHFQKHLIDKKWVDEQTSQLIQAMLDYRLGDLESLKDYHDMIEKMIDRVNVLYESLDANLKFTIAPLQQVQEEQVQEQTNNQYFVDLRGTACPMNFVMAKLALEKIPIGESLEVYLDEGEPIRNVPASFQEQQQEVVHIGDAPDQGKSLTIKRVR